MKTLIKNAEVVNDGKSFVANVLIVNDIIDSLSTGNDNLPQADCVIDASGMLLLPGAIDDQVHFREPGLTHKADIESESAAAVAGGVTSFMDMPNTIPQTTTAELLEQKYSLAEQKSLANYSFYIGATNDNIDVVKSIDYKRVCGIKLFMGSSTGNMLVDNDKSLARIFAEAPAIITTHCEDEATVRANMEHYRNLYGDNAPFSVHSKIRSDEACYRSSAKAVELADKYNSKLHVLHISSAKEMSLFESGSVETKRITGEVCVHHLWFTEDDYEKYGARIKWNPSVKSAKDRDALRAALISGKLDVVATDHAPHTIAEKDKTYFKAPSGGPMVQHSLVAMLDMAENGVFSKELAVEKMCHAPAKLYQIPNRGYIKSGYKADLVLVAKQQWTVSKENILYKCGWSPLEGVTMKHKVIKTFVNGRCVYDNGTFDKSVMGERLMFNR